MNKIKYNVGDKVRVTKAIVEADVKYVGKIFTVSKVMGDEYVSFYYVKENPKISFVISQLKLIKEPLIYGIVTFMRKYDK